MNGHLTLILLFFGGALVACSRFPLRRYTYFNTKMTWAEARLYCRQHYTDLATFESVEEIQQLHPAFSYSWAWIGLYDDPGSWRGVMGHEPNSWRWSSSGQTSSSGFQEWSQGEPDYRDRDETCVLMDTVGEWRDKPCGSLKGFVCVTESDSSQISYLYISALRTWAAAQAYCREHHTDLAFVESAAQNSLVSSARTASADVWIGLYREPWAWSDRSLSPFKYWRNISPNGPYYQHCLTENEAHVWDDEQCHLKHVGICHTVLKLRSFVRVMLGTGADLTQPLTNAQILQKVEAALKNRGWSDFRLTWTIQPLRQTITERTPKPQCDNI